MSRNLNKLAYLEAMGISVWVRRDAQPGDAVRRDTPSADRADAAGPVSEPAGERTQIMGPVTSDEVANTDWPALRGAVAGCTLCGLERTRTQTVFGVGDTAAEWLLIGEAPGAEEDRRGEPFVGRAGQLLNNMLAAVGLSREQVFIANILKCRPPNNRDPQPDEVSACLPYLNRQIALMEPRVIVALGRVAAQNLLASTAPLGKLRGRRHYYEPTRTPLIVTYHPAYLLRSPKEKRKAWQDLLLARQLASTA